jgi:hypothetical protein
LTTNPFRFLAFVRAKSTIFASQVLRPVVAILLYIVAAALGWFVHPLSSVGIFVIVVGYYAWTTPGHPFGSKNWPASDTSVSRQSNLKARIGVCVAGRGGIISPALYEDL